MDLSLLIRSTSARSSNASGPQIDTYLGLNGLNLFEPRLVEPLTDVTIPLDDSVIFVSLFNQFNCAEFSSRLSEVSQTLDAISRNQFLVAGRGLGEPWLLGSI